MSSAKRQPIHQPNTVGGGQRVALITGASSGIGRACAIHLAERGIRVYGTSRRAHAEPIETVAGPVPLLTLDITSDESVARGVDAIMSREGRLDILVNNAGMGLAGPIESTATDEAVHQFDVNFFGALRACRCVLPVMRQQRSGRIVNIGSIAGLIAIPYQAMYSASKFALEGFSEALRLEVAALGIHVVLVEPGDHRTAFTGNRVFTESSQNEEAYRHAFAAAVQRMARDEQSGPSPEKVARLIGRIVDLPKPRLRYTVGPFPQRTAVWLKRLLPNRLLEEGLRRYYRLDR